MTYGSVVSAMASEMIDCCESYQEGAAASHARKLSAMGVTVSGPLSVVEEPVSEAEQAVTVEHERVMVEVDAVFAPDGVNIENDVSQALIVCVEQELLDPLRLDSVLAEEAGLVG